MIKSLQILRGVAALLVVLYHATDPGVLPQSMDSWVLCRVGSIGVNLFFIISGFIMYHVTDNHSNPWKFIGRRLVRIVPLYWILLFFGKGLGAFSNPMAYKSMFFLPLTPDGAPFFGWAYWNVGWTLNYEMFFYLVFFGAMFLGKHRFWAIGVVFTLLHVAFMALTHSPLAASFSPYTQIDASGCAYLNMMLNPLILLFGVGIVLGYLYKKSRGLAPGYDLVALTVACAGIVLFFNRMGFDEHGLRSSFFCFCLFVAALSTERFLERSHRTQQLLRPLVYLGTISYSIYLTHMIFVSKTEITHLPIPAWLTLLLLLGLTVGLSHITHALIEQRLSGYLKRKLGL